MSEENEATGKSLTEQLGERSKGQGREEQRPDQGV